MVGETGPLFRDQITSVRESSMIFERVRAEMEEFLGMINRSTASVGELEMFQRQFGESMASVTAVVQQTSASTQEVASMSSQQFIVSEELVALSAKLEELAESLKQSLVSFQR
ncbi:hypothetical protein D3C75_1013850 [compost metagenome]